MEESAILSSAISDSKVKEFDVKCHCDRVRGKFIISKTDIVAIDCNCTDCNMRKNIKIVIPKEDFTIAMQDNENFEDATILYEWGTKTAKRRFCKTCGILPWYIPRSNPDGIALTLNCIDWGEIHTKPNIEIRKYDGLNWEKAFGATNITEQSHQKSCGICTSSSGCN